MEKVNLNEFRDYAIEHVPSYALNYLVNSDPSGLSDDDIHNIEEWADGMSAAGFDPTCFDFIEFGQDGELYINDDAEPSFYQCPAFGMATDAYTCLFVRI